MSLLSFFSSLKLVTECLKSYEELLQVFCILLYFWGGDFLRKCDLAKYIPNNRLLFFSQQILNNYVQFEVYSGMTQVASLKMTQSRVSDGEWHHLLIELKSAKDGKDIKYLAVMSLDYGMYQVQQH